MKTKAEKEEKKEWQSSTQKITIPKSSRKLKKKEELCASAFKKRSSEVQECRQIQKAMSRV
jgi:hypothetical protein